jgi:hypothetical protein
MTYLSDAAGWARPKFIKLNNIRPCLIRVFDFATQVSTILWVRAGLGDSMIAAMVATYLGLPQGVPLASRSSGRMRARRDL